MSKRYFINNIDTVIGRSILNAIVPPGEPIETPVHMATYYDTERTDK
jgi:hypothetical protein